MATNDLVGILENEYFTNVKVQIIKILGRVEKVDLDLFKNLLGNKSSKVRQCAAQQLINRRIDKDEYILSLMQSEDFDTSWSAAFVLGSLGYKEALNKLLEIFDIEKYKWAREPRDAVDIIAQFKPDISKPLLWDIYKSEDNIHAVRWRAVYALSQQGERAVEPELIDMLNSGYLDEIKRGLRGCSKIDLQAVLYLFLKEKSQGWQTAAVELFKKEKCTIHDLRDAIIDSGTESTNTIIDILSKNADEALIDWLIDALQNPYQHTHEEYFSNRVAIVIEKSPSEIVGKRIDELRKIKSCGNIEQLFWLVPSIQYQCGYYSHLIFQQAQQMNQQTKPMSEQSNISIGTVNGNVNFGENYGGQHTTTTSTQNDYSTDPKTQKLIIELQDFLAQMQTQHPDISTESEAMAVVEAELMEVQNSPTSRFMTLRTQLRNPERHLQGLKAAVSAGLNHALQENILAKMLFAYLDKMSETPNCGT